MATTSDPERAANEPVDLSFDESGIKRELTGYAAKLVAFVALAFSTYQLIIAGFSPLSSLSTRSIHGTFLEHAGMINLFNSIALGFVGHARGGPAKVAVISSGMMGTISGSGVANVLTVGQFTIPLMKRFGYAPIFAGAVEATSSMGGQIMPPVMGAVAFIMAETLNVPYVAIVKAAVIPAILYYLTAFWMVHLEAGRKGLHGLPKEQCPNPWQAICDQWYLMLPLAVLVFMLFDGFTPMFSGIVGLALTAVLILGVGIAAGVGSTLFRIVLWIVLGLGTASF